jgi:hypothetical protein
LLLAAIFVIVPSLVHAKVDFFLLLSHGNDLIPELLPFFLGTPDASLELVEVV